MLKEHSLCKGELKKGFLFRSVLFFLNIVLEVLATAIRQKFVCLFLPCKNAPLKLEKFQEVRKTVKRILGKQDNVQILTSFCWVAPMLQS